MSSQTKTLNLTTIPEKLEYSYPIYFNSSSVDKLIEVSEILNGVIIKNLASAENKIITEKLYYLSLAKAYSIKYFDGGYLEEDFETLNSFLTVAISRLGGVEYAVTLKTLNALKNLADVIHSVMADASNEISRVRDYDDTPLTNDKALLKEVADIFDRKAEEVENAVESGNVFGDRVKIFDIKAQAISDLKAISTWCNSVIEEADKQGVDEFLKAKSQSLNDLNGDKLFSYRPSFIDRSTTPANAIILSSPFDDEVVLFARAYQTEYLLDFIVLNAFDFENKSAGLIYNVIKVLHETKKSLLLLGISNYYGDNKNQLIKTLIEFSSKGFISLVHDNKGDKGVYETFYAIVKENSYLITSVTSKFIAMPVYKDVIDEFESKGMITSSDYEYVRKNFAFMGYVGFNKGVTLFVQGKNWKDELKYKSDFNHNIALAYLKNVPSQTQLVDISWGDLNLERNTDGEKKEFDYDTVKASNPENIKKILQAKCDIFQKCGLILRYCTLCGDDVSVWKDLSSEVKSDRINDATKILAHILQTEYSPEVQVVPDSEWTVKGAGGLCCDGGKLIKYKEDCIDDYDWLVKAVAHEVFHAFQHTAVNNGWRKWYWAELGITQNRLPQWDYNFNHYSGNTSSQIYRVEIVECDARTFENDCFDKSKGVWNTIDLE